MSHQVVKLNDSDEEYVPIDDVFCLFSAKLMELWTGIRGFTPLPWRIRGISPKSDFYVFGNGPVYRSWPVLLERSDLTNRLIGLISTLPRNTGDLPVVVDIEDDGRLVVVISQKRRVQHIGG